MFKAGDKVVFRDRYQYQAPWGVKHPWVMTVLEDTPRKPNWGAIQLRAPEGQVFRSYTGYLKKYKAPALKFGVSIELSTRSVDKATKLAEQLAKNTGYPVKVIHV